jgi:ubiquitin C-terminal hydrolase
LHRFELDYQTWQRHKLNDRFEFPVEIDMSPYVSPELLQSASQDELVYELKSIVIHRGGAYGGHYYAYIKDDLGIGNWDVEKLDRFEDKPVEVTTKGYNIGDWQTE